LELPLGDRLEPGHVVREVDDPRQERCLCAFRYAWSAGRSVTDRPAVSRAARPTSSPHAASASAAG
jgi:hypothetical protein